MAESPVAGLAAGETAKRRNMHYKNGREAKAGDQIVGRGYDGTVMAGMLVKPDAASDTCNGRLIASSIVDCAPLINLKDFVHADDITLLN